jgi:hypothetical protein
MEDCEVSGGAMFYFEVTRNGTITRCRALGNGDFALYISGNYTTVRNCVLKGYLEGIIVGGSFNHLYYNRIGDMYRENAYDYGTGNVWDDDVFLGNFWDDAGPQGPYHISGDAGSVDRWPVLLEGNSPEIAGVTNLEMYFGETLPIVWNVSDQTPRSYRIYVNDTEAETGARNGSDVVFYFNPCAPGFYNVTLVLDDMNDNSARASLLVVVNSVPTLPTTSTNAKDLGNVLAVAVYVGLAVVFVLTIVFTLKKWH